MERLHTPATAVGAEETVVKLVATHAVGLESSGAER